MKSYFEIHVVVKPPIMDSIVIGKACGFWGAILAHDEGDEEEKGDLILTSRADNIGIAKNAIATVYTVHRIVRIHGCPTQQKILRIIVPLVLDGFI